MSRILLPFLLLLGVVYAQASGTSPAPAPETAEASDAQPPARLPAPTTQQQWALAPVPDWVEPKTANHEGEPPFGDVSAGTYYRLVDLQVDVESHTTFAQYSREILSNAGLHGMSELEFDYDPTFQEIRLHKIEIVRDGKTTSLFDPSRIRLLQKENETHNGIWNGEKTLVHFLPGLRVGDILEYSYSIVGSHPAMGGKFTDSFLLEWEEEVLEASYRLRKPNDRRITYRSFGSDIEPREVEGETHTNLYWERENVAAVLMDENVPAWYHSLAWVQLSEFGSWAEVARWGAKLFAEADGELSKEALAVVKETEQRYPALTDQVMALKRWVSDEIRYVGIEGGAASYCPRTPALTLKNRFGDCKDKTLLLSRMLRELGVESAPLYVDSQEGRALPDLLPSPTAFDHVILRVRMPDGREFDCDPTMSGQGGSFDQFHLPNYHWGLVLEPGSRSLTELKRSTSFEDSCVTIIEDYILGDPGGKIDLVVETDFVGSMADTVRREMASTTPAHLNRSYLNYYLDNYPYTTAANPLSYRDNRGENTLRVKEHYHIDELWEADASDPNYLSLRLYFAAIRNSLDMLSAPQRESPLALRYPKDVVQIVRIHGDINALELNTDPVTVNGPGFEFSRSVEQYEDYLEFNVSYKTLRDYVDVEELQEYYDATQAMVPHTSALVWFNTAIAATNPATAGAAVEDLATSSSGEGEESSEFLEPIPGLSSQVWLWAEQPLNPGMVLMFTMVIVLGAALSALCSTLQAKGEVPALRSASLVLRDMTMGWMLLMPLVALGLLPFQFWHLFVIPVNLEENYAGFDFTSMLQTFALALKCLALVAALAAFWLLVKGRRAGLLLGRIFFISYPFVLGLGLALNALQHPHTAVMIGVSAFEIGLAVIGLILGLRFLFGTGNSGQATASSTPSTATPQG